MSTDIYIDYIYLNQVFFIRCRRYQKVNVDAIDVRLTLFLLAVLFIFFLCINIKALGDSIDKRKEWRRRLIDCNNSSG